MTDESIALTPEMLLAAYTNGYFPMAMEKDDPELYWFSPEERGVLPIAQFNVPRGLARAMKTHTFTLTVDRAFERVIRACGTLTPARRETWINETIVGLYTALHRQGHAHSVEVWHSSPTRGEDGRGAVTGKTSPIFPTVNATFVAEAAHSYPDIPPPTLPPTGGGTLVGGLYGVSIGGAFFGESMFSRAPEASKIALVTLVDILRDAGYALLDTQYVNDHLKQFGVEAVPKRRYMTKLANALKASPNPSTLFSTVSVRKGLASASSAS